MTPRSRVRPLLIRVFAHSDTSGETTVGHAAWLWEDADHPRRFYSTPGKPNSAGKGSPHGFRLEAHLTRHGMRVDTLADVWNPRLLEITAAVLHPGDNAASWAAILHQHRYICAHYADPSPLPAELHFANKIGEYLLPYNELERFECWHGHQRRCACAGKPAHVKPRPLNPRQSKYLELIYQADKEAEEHQRWQWYQHRHCDPADHWRWIPYSTDHPRASPTGLQESLMQAGVHDPGSGATLAALIRRGVIEARTASVDSAYGPARQRRVRRLNLPSRTSRTCSPHGMRPAAGSGLYWPWACTPLARTRNRLGSLRSLTLTTLRRASTHD